MELTTRVAVPLAAAATTVIGLLAGPAAAERASYPDPADVGGASLNDIRRVTVDHTASRLAVRVEVTDLRRHSEQGPAGLTIRIDTRSAASGPEYRLTTGLYEDTDYQLVRMRHQRQVGEPLTCDHSVHLGFASDVVRFTAARECLGSPDRARVGVKMVDLYDGSHPTTDWLGAAGSWTDWLSAG